MFVASVADYHENVANDDISAIFQELRQLKEHIGHFEKQLETVWRKRLTRYTSFSCFEVVQVIAKK